MKPITAAAKRSLPRSKPAPAPAKVQGGSDVDAARRHRAALKKFVASGQVADAAREAEPRTPVEEVEMFDAERIGQAHSKGEDRAPFTSPDMAQTNGPRAE